MTILSGNLTNLEAGGDARLSVPTLGVKEQLARLSLAVSRLLQDDRTRAEQAVHGAGSRQNYDSLLQAWAHVLELRDVETVEHTRRVTELSLQLARNMGITGDTLVHIGRGALLHDIGKLGIPDKILLKPGPLTPEEWLVMQQHPVFAYLMLSPIEFLRPALDIPLSHHEKWDGSGYPYRLKGEDIPLDARIFAIVDVWDALNSSRPYRPEPWPREKIVGYLKDQSRLHFDPAVVKAFLELIPGNGKGKAELRENQVG